MPVITVKDATCYYRLDGGDDLPVLMLSHSLGQDHGMWDAQAADLAPYFRVLRYDVRGHGASAVTVGDYRIEQLGEDALALADALGIGTFAFCGLSLGGMIGQWVAVNAPDRLTALVLANTSPRTDAAGMETRRQTVLRDGMPGVASLVMGRFFSPEVLAANSPVVARARRTLLATNPAGYAGCCAAIRDMDHTAALSRIRARTLVIAGDRDVSLPWAGHGEVLTGAIPNAQAIHLPAAHLSNLEVPRSFTSTLFDFLLATEADSFAAGLRVRRAALGHAHVDRALGSSSDFTRAFQELLTRYAWGSVWSRPGLDHRTRRLLVLVITAALGRWEEFRLHLRAGLEHELEPCDVKEALLQTAIYAGVPAANTAFHIASEVLSARGNVTPDGPGTN